MKTKLILDVHKVEHAQLNYIVMGRVSDKVSNVVDVYIVDGSVPYPLTSLGVFYECVKPNNTVVRDSNGVKMIDAAKGHFEYTFPPEVFGTPGKMERSFFAIEKNKEMRASTQDFMVVCLPNALDGRIESGQFISDLEKLIDQANSIIKHIKELEQQANGIIDKELKDLRKKSDEMMKKIQTDADKVIKGIEANFDGVKKQIEELQKKLDTLDVVKRSGDTMTGELTAPSMFIGTAANRVPVATTDKVQMHKLTSDNGNCISLDAKTDLNMIIKAGFYKGNNLVNTPTKAAWWYIQVYSHNDSAYACMQVAYSLDDPNTKSLYTRKKSNKTWTEWERVVTASEIEATWGNWRANAAVWFSMEHTKYGNGESVISQKAVPRWAAGRTVEMSQDGTYKIQEDGIYDIQAFLRIGTASQDSQHILSIHILNSSGQFVESHELCADIVQIDYAHNRFEGAFRWNFNKGEQFRFVYRHNNVQGIERQISRLAVTRLTYGLEESNSWD